MKNLNQYINILKSDPIARGSAILFVGSFVVNIFSYIYNLIIGRMLGPVLYGEYLSLITIVYLVSIPFGTVQTIVIKYVSQLNSQNESQKIKILLIMLTKYITIFASIVSIVLILTTPVISNFLKIDDIPAIVLMGITFTAFTVPTVLVSAFNGLERFLEGTVINGVALIFRIVMSILAIGLGFGVGGVFGALIVGSMFGYGLLWYYLNKYLDSASHKRNLITKINSFFRRLAAGTTNEITSLKEDIIKFTIPAVISTIGIAAITQVDIIFAKAFFSPEDAGIYSSLAIIGKVIPFFTIPLLTALFPQLVAKVTRKENFLKPFYAILGIITVASLCLSIFYFIFPEFIINMFFGKQYMNAVPYIGLFGLFQTVYAIMNAYVNFFLAIGKNKLAAQAIVAVILQSFLIMIFHKSLYDLILVSLCVCALFTIYYSVCTLQLAYNTKKISHEPIKKNII